MSKLHFIEGMEVAHIGNLQLKMWVKEIKTRKIKQSTGEVSDDATGFRKEYKTRMEGIITYYFSDGKEIENPPYHSAQIIPWEIAKLGSAAAEEWAYENNQAFFNKVNSIMEPAKKQAQEIIQKYE